MARKKLSEYTAKTLLFGKLDLPYMGRQLTQKNAKEVAEALDQKSTYVVKVDEGVKGRGKKGLVFLNVMPKDIPAKVIDLASKGYSQFLAEPFVAHQSGAERYFSIERSRDGKIIYYAAVGGIDIEQNQDKIKKAILSGTKSSDVIDTLGMPEKVFENILHFFDREFVSFLEVNPFVTENNTYHFLDLAVEVDSTAEFFVQNSWTAKDFVGELGGQTQEEQNILALKAKSQAAFKFDLLNPNGSIWVLLSGGGASIVLADEVYNQGWGEELANYGEYSGNPNQEETYIYTKNVLSLLLTSKAEKKVLIIGGGVANFTDVKTTFKGVIRALDEVKEQLAKAGV
ncbi:MAG: hypothetical protein KGL95_13545, partial [Patescibacteria group bacterium]|nr:hypothetical protein [Patescibacteria group bacterium]